MNIHTRLKEELTQADTIYEVIRDEETPFEEIDWDDIQDKVRERIDEAVLSIDINYTVDVLLGCGGPTVYFSITLDEDGDPIRGKYVNTSFEDRKEIELSSSEVDLIAERYSLSERIKSR